MLKLLSFLFQEPNAIDRFNPLAKPSSTLLDTSRFTSSNPSLVTGRHSPVYVAVPVDRPPVKLKPKIRSSAQDTNVISTINELRSKLLNVDDSGYKQILPGVHRDRCLVRHRTHFPKCCVTFQLTATKKSILIYSGHRLVATPFIRSLYYVPYE